MSLNLTGFKFNANSKFKDRPDLVVSLYYGYKTQTAIAEELGLKDRSQCSHLKRRLVAWVEANPGALIKVGKLGTMDEEFRADLENFRQISKDMLEELKNMVDSINIEMEKNKSPSWYDAKLRAMKMLKDFMGDYWERFGQFVNTEEEGDSDDEFLEKRLDKVVEFIERHAPEHLGAFIDHIEGDSDVASEAVQLEGQE